MNASDLVSQEFRMCKHPIPGPNCLTNKAGTCRGPTGSRVLKKSRRGPLLTLTSCPTFSQVWFTIFAYQCSVNHHGQYSTLFSFYIIYISVFPRDVTCDKVQHFLFLQYQLASCAMKNLMSLDGIPKLTGPRLIRHLKMALPHWRHRFALEIKQRMTW